MKDVRQNGGVSLLNKDIPVLTIQFTHHFTHLTVFDEQTKQDRFFIGAKVRKPACNIRRMCFVYDLLQVGNRSAFDESDYRGDEDIVPVP